MFHVGLETVLVPEQMAMFYKINIFPFFWGGGGGEKMPQSIRVVTVIRLLLSAGSVHCDKGHCDYYYFSTGSLLSPNVADFVMFWSGY